METVTLSMRMVGIWSRLNQAFEEVREVRRTSRYQYGETSQILGLSVMYSVREEEYLDFIQNAGVKVVLHGQNESVFPDAFGLNTPAGYQSSISMKLVSGSSMTGACSEHEIPCF